VRFVVDGRPLISCFAITSGKRVIYVAFTDAARNIIMSSSTKGHTGTTPPAQKSGNSPWVKGLFNWLLTYFNRVLLVVPLIAIFQQAFVEALRNLFQ